jgi:hypothetical protein
MGNASVRYVLFDVPLHPGSLTLVELDDGSLRIHMNDEPLTGCHWPAGQVSPAVRRFQELKSTLSTRDPAAPR